MINTLSVATIWVKDHNEALRFYTEKLGFEIRADVSNGDFRWLTVGLASQPDIEFQVSPLLDPALDWNSVSLAIGFSAGVGLFFGLYPATRAARLNPIDALRYE